jgi:hypothetical protein
METQQQIFIFASPEIQELLADNKNRFSGVAQSGRHRSESWIRTRSYAE